MLISERINFDSFEFLFIFIFVLNTTDIFELPGKVLQYLKDVVNYH